MNCNSKSLKALRKHHSYSTALVISKPSIINDVLIN